MRNFSSITKLNIYLKKGTTWTEEIIWLIKNNLNFDAAKLLPHFDRIAFIDCCLPQALLDKYKSPRIIKTHLPLKFLPDNFDEQAKKVFFNF